MGILFECSINSTSLADGKVVLDCNATNTTTKVITFLPWNTPLESGLFGRFFKVKDGSGKALEYQGMMVKRAGPSDADYLSLAPGDVLTNSIDLTISYNFCAASRYILNYSAEQWNADGEKIQLLMPEVEFTTPDNFSPCKDL